MARHNYLTRGLHLGRINADKVHYPWKRGANEALSRQTMGLYWMLFYILVGKVVLFLERV